MIKSQEGKRYRRRQSTKQVKSSLRDDEREWASNIAQEEEEEQEDAAKLRRIKGFYKATGKWCNV